MLGINEKFYMLLETPKIEKKTHYYFHQHNPHQMLSGTACEATLSTASTGLSILALLGLYV